MTPITVTGWTYGPTPEVEPDPISTGTFQDFDRAQAYADLLLRGYPKVVVACGAVEHIKTWSEDPSPAEIVETHVPQ